MPFELKIAIVGTVAALIVILLIFAKEKRPIVVIMEKANGKPPAAPAMLAAEFFRVYFGINLEGLNLEAKLYKYNFSILENPQPIPEAAGNFSQMSAEEMLKKYFGVNLFDVKEDGTSSDLVGVQEYKYIGARGTFETIHAGEYAKNMEILKEFVC